MIKIYMLMSNPKHIPGAIIVILHSHAAGLWNYKCNSLLTLLTRKLPTPQVKLWL